MFPLRTCLVGVILVIASASDGDAAAPPGPRVDRFGHPLPRGVTARLGTVRFRHPGYVWSLAFSPDGKTLASAGQGGVMWRVPDGRPLMRRATKGDVLVFAHTDGLRMVAREGERNVVRDAVSGKKQNEPVTERSTVRQPGSPGLFLEAGH